MSKWAGFGVVAWGPLANGLLTGRYFIDRDKRHISGEGRVTRAFNTGSVDSFRPHVQPTLNALAEISQGLGRQQCQVAIAWLLANDAIASVAVGVSSKNQLCQNLASLEVTLPPDLLSKMNAISKEPVSYPYTFLEPDVQVLVHGASEKETS